MSDLHEPSLLDRLFGHFGYEKRQPVAPTVPATEPVAAVQPPPPAHRDAQAGFDYSRAESGSMSFSYIDGEDRFS
ncbi:hypothetical protein [Paraburkholderia humisilvae]|uniref:hypothetical protein n=1 Tax=Paraburkholderia humisilvae TaxID=627669 RepID=UPI00158289C5|nr:hypothetical protein [Paraburkholderia humisilvae]